MKMIFILLHYFLLSYRWVTNTNYSWNSLVWIQETITFVDKRKCWFYSQPCSPDSHGLLRSVSMKGTRCTDGEQWWTPHPNPCFLLEFLHRKFLPFLIPLQAYCPSPISDPKNRCRGRPGQGEVSEQRPVCLEDLVFYHPVFSPSEPENKYPFPIKVQYFHMQGLMVYHQKWMMWKYMPEMRAASSYRLSWLSPGCPLVSFGPRADTSL